MLAGKLFKEKLRRELNPTESLNCVVRRSLCSEVGVVLVAIVKAEHTDRTEREDPVFFKGGASKVTVAGERLREMGRGGGVTVKVATGGCEAGDREP